MSLSRKKVEISVVKAELLLFRYQPRGCRGSRLVVLWMLTVGRNKARPSGVSRALEVVGMREEWAKALARGPKLLSHQREEGAWARPLLVLLPTSSQCCPNPAQGRHGLGVLLLLMRGCLLVIF